MKKGKSFKQNMCGPNEIKCNERNTFVLKMTSIRVNLFFFFVRDTCDDTLCQIKPSTFLFKSKSVYVMAGLLTLPPPPVTKSSHCFTILQIILIFIVFLASSSVFVWFSVLIIPRAMYDGVVYESAP